MFGQETSTTSIMNNSGERYVIGNRMYLLRKAEIFCFDKVSQHIMEINFYKLL